jgi:hypothetical protein
VEHARSAQRARSGTDDIGCIEGLCTFFGTAATKCHSAWDQQEYGEQGFLYGEQRKLAELMSRELGCISFTVLLIDGVQLGEHLLLAAVGIDEQGDKHVLGLREGCRPPTLPIGEGHKVSG